APFLEYLSYRASSTCLVFQRRLDQALNVVDVRFAALRRKYSMKMVPRSGASSWWQECVLGPVEPFAFRLQESATSSTVARAEEREMEAVSCRWGVPSTGIFTFNVREDLRRQGLGKFLLTSILKYLQEQYYGIIEAQVPERNQAAVKLFQSVGFE